jgi:hypothetical protein
MVHRICSGVSSNGDKNGGSDQDKLTECDFSWKSLYKFKMEEKTSD